MAGWAYPLVGLAVIAVLAVRWRIHRHRHVRLTVVYERDEARDEGHEP